MGGPPTAVIALVAGLFGFVLYKMIKVGASPTSETAGVRFWDKGQADALRAVLAESRLAPTTDQAGVAIERVFTVVSGAGAPDALTAVRAIQKQGHLVTSSLNLLDKTAAKRLVADVLPSEERALATAAGLAVLPPL